ncbi:hypothetical protein [Futiania mangrovi]|uniref:Uncharacterized protein n=1 Tax=Futiania mangrovi TaxID=2959716 RepID=A0A9J6PED7_9PROT|nr:hypothetical protein [Futiania mangrovii]MCP1337781.1 hypothetical protein [Futiania mangrovii]
MTPTYSRPRRQAEIAFAKAQSQFLARSPTADVVDPIAKTREEKTLRLRTARLAREQEERSRATAAAFPDNTRNGTQN